MVPEARGGTFALVFAILAVSACGGTTATGGTATDAGLAGDSDAATAGDDASPGIAVPLFSCDGVGYTVGATIGGSQAFQLLLDTGSTSLGVAAKSCSGCGVSPAYTPGATAVDEGQMTQSQYAMGGWTGEVYQDAVVVGAAPPAQVDLVAIGMQSGFFNPIQCDSKSGGVQGVLGLAPAGDAVPFTNGYFDELVAAGSTPDVFATELCNTGGTLWLGGYDPSFTTAPPQYVPLLTDGFSRPYYALDLTSVTVSGTTVPITSAQYKDSVVDTGTSQFLLGPTSFNALSAAIAQSPAFQKMVGGGASFFAQGCTQATAFSATKAALDAALPALTLSFASGAAVQALPTESYLAEVQSGVFCPVLGSHPQDPQTFPLASIMGAAILRSNVVVFDRANARIGFAPHTACP